MADLRLFTVEARGAKAVVLAATAENAERMAFENTGLEAFRHPLPGRTQSRPFDSMRSQVLMAATEDLARTWGF